MKLHRKGIKPTLEGREVGSRQIPSGSSEPSKNTRGALGVVGADGDECGPEREREGKGASAVIIQKGWELFQKPQPHTGLSSPYYLTIL